MVIFYINCFIECSKNNLRTRLYYIKLNFVDINNDNGY